MRNKDSSPLTVALIGGIALGLIASLFLPDSVKNKGKKQIEDKTNKLKNLLTDPQERERIKEIFDDQSDKAQELYKETKSTLLTNLSNLRGGLMDIDKQKYLDAVTDTVNQIKSEKNIPARQLSRLVKYLQNDYNRIKAELKEENHSRQNDQDLQG